MQLKTCEICLTEHFDELPCPNCETSIDLSEVEEAKPIGFISDETRQWLLDENGRGPGMFTPNRNGAGGVWAIYGGWEYKRLLTIAQNLQKQCVLMHGVVAAARTLYEETEEYDFPDGMGKGALQEYWDALADALEPELDAALKAAQPYPGGKGEQRRQLSEPTQPERVSVPREPTPEMLAAGANCEWSGGYDRDGSHAANEYVDYKIAVKDYFGEHGALTAAQEIYRAMLAAAQVSDERVSDERIDEIMRDCGINPSVRFGDVWTGNVQLRKFARALLREAQQAAPKGTR